MRDADYRRVLSRLRAKIHIIENNLRTTDYTFDYSKQPSRAMLKYREAFIRNDGARYRAFLESVSRGESRMHTGTLMPYDIIAPIFKGTPTKEERDALDVTWRALEDLTTDENALVVVDGSGSMYFGDNPVPASVAISLAIYFAERNHGAFANHFITFSCSPQLVELKGKTIYDKVKYAMTYNEVADTDIERVFTLLLDTAVKGNLPQSELPSKLYIISDMEFNSCAQGADITNFELAKKRFAEHGYTLPETVFWNVDCRRENMPVTKNEQGVTLVSGFTPRLFSMVQTDALSPVEFMMQTLLAPRYRDIRA